MHSHFIEQGLEFNENNDRLNDSDDYSSCDSDPDNPAGGHDYLDYKVVKSGTSHNIDEIRSIIYGGINSRFWLYRKYMNVIDHHAACACTRKNPIPFYAWECLTI